MNLLVLYALQYQRAVGGWSDVESVGGRGRSSRPHRQEVMQSEASLWFLPAGSEHRAQSEIDPHLYVAAA